MTRVGRTSLWLRYEVVRVADERLLARGTAMRVHIRRKGGRIGEMVPYPLTREMRVVLERYTLSGEDGHG